MTPRDTNNSADDEFGSSFMSEVEYNKRHRKALKKADSSYDDLKTLDKIILETTPKKKSVKKKKKGFVKIADGVYQNLAKMRAEDKPKKKKKKKTRNWFKGLGSSSRGPGNR